MFKYCKLSWFPINIIKKDLKLAKEKQLIVDNNKELYIYLANMYKYYFEMYMLEKIKIGDRS